VKTSPIADARQPVGADAQLFAEKQDLAFPLTVYSRS